MITVLLPENNAAERRYASEVLLVEFLGLNAQFIQGDTPYSAEIHLENGKRALFQDHFFRHSPAPLSYLEIENVPGQIQRFKQAENPLFPGSSVRLARWLKRVMPEHWLPTFSGDFFDNGEERRWRRPLHFANNLKSFNLQ